MSLHIANSIYILHRSLLDQSSKDSLLMFSHVDRNIINRSFTLPSWHFISPSQYLYSILIFFTIPFLWFESSSLHHDKWGRRCHQPCIYRHVINHSLLMTFHLSLSQSLLNVICQKSLSLSLSISPSLSPSMLLFYFSLTIVTKCNV